MLASIRMAIRNGDWLTDRRAHIFVASLDGDGVRQLTDGDCEDSQPAWSPDGRQIAFREHPGHFGESTKGSGIRSASAVCHARAISASASSSSFNRKTQARPGC